MDMSWQELWHNASTEGVPLRSLRVALVAGQSCCTEDASYRQFCY